MLALTYTLSSYWFEVGLWILIPVLETTTKRSMSSSLFNNDKVFLGHNTKGPFGKIYTYIERVNEIESLSWLYGVLLGLFGSRKLVVA